MASKKRASEVERLAKAWSVRPQKKKDDDYDTYTQKFVWMGTYIPENQVAYTQEFFLDTIGVRVRYLGTIVTLPPRGFVAVGNENLGWGGRCDAVFALHPQDTGKFAYARFQMGTDIPRWWEDYVANNREIIPKEDLKRF